MAEGQVVDASPIINDPYVEPARHWHFEEGHAPVIREGRRASGYLPPGGADGQLSITGELIQIDLVNDIRARVGAGGRKATRARPPSPATCSTAGSMTSGSPACVPSSPSGRRWRLSSS